MYLALATICLHRSYSIPSQSHVVKVYFSFFHFVLQAQLPNPSSGIPLDKRVGPRDRICFTAQLPHSVPRVLLNLLILVQDNLREMLLFFQT